MQVLCVTHYRILCIERALRLGYTGMDEAGGDWRVQGTSDTGDGLVRVCGGTGVSCLAAGVLRVAT